METTYMLSYLPKTTHKREEEIEQIKDLQQSIQQSCEASHVNLQIRF